MNKEKIQPSQNHLDTDTTSTETSSLNTNAMVKVANKNAVKKRGRPPKVKPESGNEDVPLKQTKVTDAMKKTKRTINRFKDVTKEELMQRFLPDRIKHGLDILIIGINPGLFAAYKGHHYAGPGNHFWKCLYLAALIPEPLTGMQDYMALNYGIGFTNVVPRTTPGSKDLSSQEIKEGGKELIEKIKTYKPKIAVFNGKGIYEIFSKEIFGQKKKDFTFGVQHNKIPGTDTVIFVMPSSSARCAQFPRAQDKVHYFIQLKKLRDELNGIGPGDDVEETNYTFDLQRAAEIVRLEKVKTERLDASYDDANHNFPGYSCPTTSSTLHHPVESTSKDQPGCSSSHALPAKRTTMPKRREKPYVSLNSPSGHPNLVKFLCQNDDSSESAPNAMVMIRSPLHNIQEVVSEEQKNERVGKWVRTQINQDYESEPPMGYDELVRRGEVSEHPESDRGSQQSMVSAGVSGSTSTGSTSGYGSVENNPHHAHQDRVEMWVREQQYVRQQSAASDLRRSQQARMMELEQGISEQPPSGSEWNNFVMPHLIFPGAASASNSANGAFRPPVPLYSSWGGNEAGRFAGLASNLNNNNSVNLSLGQPQLNVNSFMP